MNLKFSASLLGIAAALCGCAASPVMSAADRESYLQQFIGRSSAYIQTNLDLAKLGYQNASAPVLTEHQLTYTVLRPVSIPIPMAQNPALGAGAGTAVPIQPANSYDTNLQCRISFQLKQQIAQAISLSGRTC